MVETIQWTDAGVVMIDQTRLPREEKYVTCRTYEEVAEVMEVSVGTVKSRILRGRRLLKNILDPLMHAQAESAPGASPDSQNHLSSPNHSSATAPRALPAAGLVSVRTQRSTS